VQPQKEQRLERRLAAIFAADVAGYSRLMSQDEAWTLRALAAARHVIDGLIRTMAAGSPTPLGTVCWRSSRAR
jgi:class 3 adenylate cyclase